MLSLNPWDILWTIVNLLVLYAIFRKFLFQPVMNVIHEREEMINKQFEDAQKQQDDAAQMKNEYENQLKRPPQRPRPRAPCPVLRAACAKRVMIPPPWGRRSTA